MKKTLLVTSVLAGLSLVAGPTGERPNETHAWSVHDPNRPDPVKISVPANGIPSDAIVLFDGTQASVDRNWSALDGSPTKWTVKDGELVCTPGSGMVQTKMPFEDCQLHVEWKTPKDDLYGWGNSGVFLGAAYEIQILDSFEIPARELFRPANYADGQAGAIYGQSPCLVNPSRATGEWQSFDVVFHPPRFEGERMLDPGDMTIFYNGVLVQDCWKFEGPTHWNRRAKLEPISYQPAQPLRLQDHGHPVPFRNIWIRRIPSRLANTTAGGPHVKKGDVAALRHRLAGESLAFAEKESDPAAKFIRLWESYCYEPDRAVKSKIGPATTALVAAVKAKDERAVSSERAVTLQRFLKMLEKEGFLPDAGELGKLIDATVAEHQRPKAPHLRDL